MSRYVLSIETAVTADVNARYASLVVRDTDAHPDAEPVASYPLWSWTASTTTDRDVVRRIADVFADLIRNEFES